MQWVLETRADRIDRQMKPHKWFAWRPVRLTETNRIAWLEFVDRRLRVEISLFHHAVWWEYKSLKGGQL